MDETEGIEETKCNTGNFPMLCKLWLDLRNLFSNNQGANMATVDSAVNDEATNSGSSTVVKKKTMLFINLKKPLEYSVSVTSIARVHCIAANVQCYVADSKVCIIRLVHICFEKSSSYF